jgi:rare lipoprotein A
MRRRDVAVSRCGAAALSPALLPALLLSAMLALAGCGTTTKQVKPSSSGVPPASSSGNAARGEPGVPVLPPAGSGRGGYYKDDGPGDNPPPNLASVPDAQPQVEPLLPRANRPYIVFGITYTPLTDMTPFVQRGVGSWYGKKFHGQRTSSGELYDMYKMTAAHPTLPIPSYARVTNIATGRQVIVRINDRGPFHTSRIIDVSYTAALQLGFLAKGSHEVQVERLLPDEIARINAGKQASPALASAPAPAPAPASTPVSRPEAPPPVLFAVASPIPASSPAAPDIEALMLGDQAPAEASPSVLFVTAQPQPAAMAPVDVTTISATAAPPSADVAAPAAPSVAAPVVAAPEPSSGKPGFYLQLGAFSRSENAESARQRLAASAPDVGALEVVDAGAVHRLYSGPFDTREQASQALAALPAELHLKPIIVQR